jgi:hypothetical protein
MDDDGAVILAIFSVFLRHLRQWRGQCDVFVAIFTARFGLFRAIFILLEVLRPRTDRGPANANRREIRIPMSLSPLAISAHGYALSMRESNQ